MWLGLTSRVFIKPLLLLPFPFHQQHHFTNHPRNTRTRVSESFVCTLVIVCISLLHSGFPASYASKPGFLEETPMRPDSTLLPSTVRRYTSNLSLILTVPATDNANGNSGTVVYDVVPSETCWYCGAMAAIRLEATCCYICSHIADASRLGTQPKSLKAQLCSDAERSTIEGILFLLIRVALGIISHELSVITYHQARSCFLSGLSMPLQPYNDDFWRPA